MSCPTTTERPVIRDLRTGYLDRHPAYEGWVPTETRRSSWWLVLAGFLLVAFALGGRL